MDNEQAEMDTVVGDEQALDVNEDGGDQGTEEPDGDQQGEQGTEKPVIEDESLKSYVDKLKAEHDAALKRIEEQSKFIDRQGTQIGQLRKSEQRLKEVESLIQEKQRRQNELVDTFDVDRVSYDTTTRDIAKLELEKKQLEAEQHKAMIRNTVPAYDELKQKEIVEILKEDGAFDWEIPAFLEQLDSNPALAIQIAKRAEMKRKLDETAKKQEELLNRSKDVQKKMTNASTYSKGVGGSNGTPVNFSPSDIKSLSDAELDRLLNEQIKRIRR